MSDKSGFRLEKRISTCKGNPGALEAGAEVTYEVEVSNLGIRPLTGTVVDVIPEWFGTVSWSDTAGNNGDANKIEQEITVAPNTTYTMTIVVITAEPDPCKGKTFHNVASFTPEGECVEPTTAMAEVCVLGCEPLCFDPRVQGMDDRRALSILFAFSHTEWAQFIDAVNCKEVYIPGGPQDPGCICKTEPTEPTGIDKEALVACLNNLGKEGIGKIIKEQELTVEDL